jgi:hypothetical protein
MALKQEGLYAQSPFRRYFFLEGIVGFLGMTTISLDNNMSSLEEVSGSSQMMPVGKHPHQ